MARRQITFARPRPPDEEMASPAAAGITMIRNAWTESLVKRPRYQRADPHDRGGHHNVEPCAAAVSPPQSAR
jgi:hypothetical protein